MKLNKSTHKIHSNYKYVTNMAYFKFTYCCNDNTIIFYSNKWLVLLLCQSSSKIAVAFSLTVYRLQDCRCTDRVIYVCVGHFSRVKTIYG